MCFDRLIKQIAVNKPNFTEKPLFFARLNNGPFWPYLRHDIALIVTTDSFGDSQISGELGFAQSRRGCHFLF